PALAHRRRLEPRDDPRRQRHAAARRAENPVRAGATKGHLVPLTRRAERLVTARAPRLAANRWRASEKKRAGKQGLCDIARPNAARYTREEAVGTDRIQPGERLRRDV